MMVSVFGCFGPVPHQIFPKWSDSSHLALMCRGPQLVVLARGRFRSGVKFVLCALHVIERTLV